MKKISLLLVVVVLSTMLTACIKKGVYPDNSYLPDGYTCGFDFSPGQNASAYWVETYDEAISAMEKLKSHGSTFDEGLIFTHESDLFDTKYCFIFNENKSDKIQFGDDPYDRKSTGVVVHSYAFFKDVSIDELVYDYYFKYDAYTVSKQYAFDYKFGYEVIKDLDIALLERQLVTETLEDGSDELQHACYLIYEGERIISVHPGIYSNNERPSAEAVDAIINSIEFIGFDD